MNSTRSGGFSLVEAVVATLILGIGLVGMTKAITAALASSHDAEHYTRAVLLAAEQMELVLNDAAYIQADEKEGDFEEAFSGYNWKAVIKEAADDGLFEVSVTVFLTATGERLYELTSLAFSPPVDESLDEETRDRDVLDGASGRALR
jgi:Tfp pilus assembly protein PilV